MNIGIGQATRTAGRRILERYGRGPVRDPLSEPGHMLNIGRGSGAVQRAKHYGLGLRQDAIMNIHGQIPQKAGPTLGESVGTFVIGVPVGIMFYILFRKIR